MVKRTSSLASNEKFQVRFLVELLTIDCRVGVHAYGAGCRGFESHRRDIDANHRAVAQPG